MVAVSFVGVVAVTLGAAVMVRRAAAPAKMRHSVVDHMSCAGQAALLHCSLYSRPDDKIQRSSANNLIS